MGQSGILSYLNAGVALESLPRVGHFHQVAEIVLGHPWIAGKKCSFIRSESYFIGQLHQLKLVSALDHAAAGGHRRGADDLERRRCLGDPVGVNKTNRLFDSQLARFDPSVLQAFSNALIRILILLPEPDFRFGITHAEGDLLARAVIFKRRTYIKRTSFG